MHRCWSWLSPIKIQFMLALLTFMLVPSMTVAWFSFGYLHDRIVENRIQAVGRVADQRHDELRLELTRLAGRAKSLLIEIAHRCSVDSSDLDCGQPALNGFLKAESALGAFVRRSEAPVLKVGDVDFAAEQPMPLPKGQLARVSGHGARPERILAITVEDVGSRMLMTVTYPAEKLQQIFTGHPDLGASGETFLVDPEGFFITQARYPSVQGRTRPVSATPMRRCLSPQSSETLDLDYRDVPIIHGFRNVPEIGGGCIMAHVDQAEAFGPLEDLTSEFFLASLFFSGLAVATSMTFAHKMVAPINHLTSVAREITLGNMSVRANPGGGHEMNELARAFNIMTSQLESVSEELENKVHERTRSLNLMAKVFTDSGEAILLTDKDNLIVAANRAFTDLTGYTEDEVKGRNPKLLSAGRTSRETYQAMWASIARTGAWEGELWDRRKSGECYPKWLSIMAVRDEQGKLVNYIGRFSDISERKATEEKVLHQALHDALTDLPNRLHLQQRLTQEINTAKRNKTKLAFMLLDLDHFKPINDNRGHHVGDQLLIQVAKRLMHSVRETDLVARLGGDEFVVLLTGLESMEDAARIAESLVEAVSAPYLIDDQALHTSPSIGICAYPEDATEIADLLKCSDAAMYEAKRNGGAGYRFFG